MNVTYLKFGVGGAKRKSNLQYSLEIKGNKKFFWKGQVVSVFTWDAVQSLLHLLTFAAVHWSSPPVHKWAWPCANKTLFSVQMGAEGHSLLTPAM